MVNIFKIKIPSQKYLRRSTSATHQQRHIAHGSFEPFEISTIEFHPIDINFKFINGFLQDLFLYPRMIVFGSVLLLLDLEFSLRAWNCYFRFTES